MRQIPSLVLGKRMELALDQVMTITCVVPHRHCKRWCDMAGKLSGSMETPTTSVDLAKDVVYQQLSDMSHPACYTCSVQAPVPLRLNAPTRHSRSKPSLSTM